MVDVVYALREMPNEKYVVVHAHRLGVPESDKGYFFLSDEKDWGGSGPFDMPLQETIERAVQAAKEHGLRTVVVLGKS